MIPQNSKIPPQKGLSQRSVLLCPNIYLYDHYTVQEKNKSFDDTNGPFALAKITQVPNHRKFIETFIVKYHSIHKDIDGWVTELPKNNFVKKYLQDGVDRANINNWRFKETKKKTSETLKRKKEKD